MTQKNPAPFTQLKSLTIRAQFPVIPPGEVWLVGAGVGDPGVMTVHALNALSQADFVIYDDLINLNIRAWGQTDAIWQYVGKRQGVNSVKQQSIARRLVELARAGKRVVRLKGGDPFVFGRGGEEALALIEAGIGFRIIPGISAAIGGLGYAGIPLTHRGINRSVIFVTGHNQNSGNSSSINWQAVADSAPVIVIYMGLKNIASITKELLKAGRKPSEPAAIICSASLPNQQVSHTSLHQLPEAAQNLSPPALVVIGKTTPLGQVLDWLPIHNDHLVKPLASDI